MVLNAWSFCRPCTAPTWPAGTYSLLLLVAWAVVGYGMTDEAVSSLRQDTRDLFYHGYTNYLTHAFPEDELKPISCRPQTRNRENPADIGLNDVLGNYSLTLIDSLSSLAILASGENDKDGHDALHDFQSGIQALVELYGNGTMGSCGKRACGFNLDSKVQVFETNIRGVGGLLSAHLFAVGSLPIRGYNPKWTDSVAGARGINWNGWQYDGQLLRLAHDLALRLLPAFETDTGLPYPRVNLRTGIPFYQQESGVCHADGRTSDPHEITETCAAGAGSLLLEFATLSRLTGESKFEALAKKAFWSVWKRRSHIGLIGGGIDAESGQWISPPLAGVGAGIDSFFEYALKSHVLLSNLPDDQGNASENAPDNYLLAWEEAHMAVKRHIYRNAQTDKHPFYGQVDMVTGAHRYNWVDNLSAYYPGLLTQAGELEEAIESHLLYSALWTRYSALPERWHTSNAFIDPNFKHWAGRPEFIESTYYLFQATKDPYYLHVGEMTLRDIRRRCWTKCGWADLGDVVSGEQRDRMESFFLGETAKYLYLLFDASHPLNHVDAPMVFSTEGHPLIIPRVGSPSHQTASKKRTTQILERDSSVSMLTCPAPAPPLPLTVSNVANRADLFHAAAMAQLHLVPMNPSRPSPILEASADGPGISILDVRSPTNYTFYPWTLPIDLVPVKGYSSVIRSPVVSTLTFPNLFPGSNPATDSGIIPLGALHKVIEGVVINSLSNIRLNMVEQPKSSLTVNGDGGLVEMEIGKEYRVHGIASWALGRDEKVLLSAEALQGVSPTDPHFTRVKDLEMVDLVIDVPLRNEDLGDTFVEADSRASLTHGNKTVERLWEDLEAIVANLLTGSVSQPEPLLNRAKSEPVATQFTRLVIPAILPTGAGAAPLPASVDDTADMLSSPTGVLPFRSIYFLDDTLCKHQLPAAVVKAFSILVIKRGGCSFSDKLANIPPFPPSAESLQLVIVLSVPEEPDDVDASQPPHSEKDSHASSKEGAQSAMLIRPLLDKPQFTPNGFERRNPISMVMIEGSEEATQALKDVASSISTFDEAGRLIESHRSDDSNPTDDNAAKAHRKPVSTGKGALGVKRRYWFESLGVPIMNLMML